MHLRTLPVAGFCLLLFPVCPVCAELVPVLIEGKVLVSASTEQTGRFAYFMEGDTASITPAAPQFHFGDLSPYMNRVAYSLQDGWPPATGDIWAAQVDGSDAIQVTTLGTVGGVNCRPEWSPDASQIAFQHVDPVPDVLPCDTGFSVWVVNADGTNPRRVSPGVAWNATWSPNGYRITCATDAGPITVDTDGTDVHLLPNVADAPDWSPDGTRIASSTCRPDTVDGEPGVWRELLLTNGDGGDPRVLVARFLKDSDVETHLARDWPYLTEDHLTIERVRSQVGPGDPEWSPRGDRMLVRAALPFDPDGPWCAYQSELYIYDLNDDSFTQITENDIHEYIFSWNGDNTFPDNPTVQVDNMELTFDTVLAEGVTTIVRDDDPPEFGTGFQFGYEFYEIASTAEITGPVTICFSYTDEMAPPGPAEDGLAILHWDADLSDWVDVTVSQDIDQNVICGESASLSPFAVYGARRTRFPDVPAWGFGTEGLDPHWAYVDVELCVRAGIVQGYPDGSYLPLGTVTRAQMAVYIARAMAGADWLVPDGPSSASFSDVDSDHWAYRHVEYAAAQGVVAGYPGGDYRPDLQVDRGQMAVYIARARGWSDTTPIEFFADVPVAHWAAAEVTACVANGVVSGYEDGLYHPERTVTRDQMAVYIARGFDLGS